MSRSCRTLWLLLVVVLALVGGTARADDGPPLEIRLEVPERGRLEELSRLVGIDAVGRSEVLAVATPSQLESLAAAGFTWRVVGTATVKQATMCPAGWQHDGGRSWTCYPSYDQYVGLLERLADDHPTLCRLVDLGVTTNRVRPHRLWALVVSDNPSLEENEPEVLLTSTMHGNEATGFVLLLRLAHELLAGYGTDLEISSLVDGFEIWITPNANPDGTYFESDHSLVGAIRHYVNPDGSASEVDANRNFPDPDEGENPDGNPWWPETLAMMRFADEHSITLSANLHDGSEVVNYPWDTWSRRHVDDDFLVDLSRGWADAAQEDGPDGYMTDLDNGITNGWDWYPVAGGRQDFMTFWHSSREVTVEISGTKTPPAASLEALWQANRRALLSFMARAGGGLHGVVTGISGEPLRATVELLGHDSAIDRSTVETDPDVGDYHRLLLSGTYTVSITAPGHETVVFGGVTVSEDAPTILDAVLEPLSVPGRVRRPIHRRPLSGDRALHGSQGTVDDPRRATPVTTSEH